MPNITLCTNCGVCYEEVSSEAAGDPNRLCMTCFNAVSRHPLSCGCSLCVKWWKQVPPEEQACVDCGLWVEEERGPRCLPCERTYARKMKEAGN